MALLLYDNGRQVPEYRCGGTLINKRYILTAAHCVTLLTNNFRLIGVRLGEHDLSTERDCDKDADGLEVVCAERYQDFGIESVHYHPEYSNVKLINDIGLIRLNADADLTPQSVRPICLPIGTAANITRKKFKSKVNISYKQICAGGKRGLDSCSGDSGGPLQAPGVYDNNLRYVQYGVVSFGTIPCATEGSAGVYTHIAYYMDWILNTITETCVSPRNKPGVCTNIYNCKPIIEIFQTRKPLLKELQDYMSSLQCGFENTVPKVCCEQQMSGIPDPPDVTNHPNLPLLSHDVCGPVTQQKIFGGNKTGVFDFPWMAMLLHDNGRETRYRCGGTLINKRYILTAAHCVTLLENNFQLIGVRLGDHDLSTERDCDKDADGLEVVCAERYQDFGIESVHYHPEYSNVKLINDIGLIRLNADADLTPQSVRPICLPTGTAANITRKKMIATGWGMTERGLRSQDLLQVQLPLVSLEKCKNQFKSKVNISYKQICAGGKRGLDSCSGDSGGPLQALGVYDNNLRYVQHGIVSFGPKNCGMEGFAAVHTRVAYYMDWILNTITA
ncbi:Serine protease easter [Habropoda laboriosa]|uniref:CLIP domain-containing serine protease n=1 Tax=Habropoda laboriosa TaxID=597456 RepID=A0A0L7QXJ6_9HYME|nr:Serine protease easter [Habropoda laboriosa]